MCLSFRCESSSDVCESGVALELCYKPKKAPFLLCFSDSHHVGHSSSSSKRLCISVQLAAGFTDAFLWALYLAEG